MSGSERRRPGWFLDMKYQTCYHIMLSIIDSSLDTAVGEVFCVIKNTMDRYTVTVNKDGMIIGHLLKKALRVCSLRLQVSQKNHLTNNRL